MIYRKFKPDDYVVARALTEEQLAAKRERTNDPGWEDVHCRRLIGLKLLVQDRFIERHTISYGCVVDDETSPYHRECQSFDEERLDFHPDCPRLPDTRGW